MPTFTMNGQDIPFEKGDTIMRAAWRAGIEIPHYCWHPGLSVAANCRMCLVHIKTGRQGAMPIMKFDAKSGEYVPDTKPKLWPACQMGAQEGMDVTSESDDVKKAQASVQEFLLLNHPVDCPICDQAGECKLQDYWLEHQNSMKRKQTEPVHKPKGVKFGPTIVYDAERCIMCTRCIRVCDELVGDPVLDMRERGNRNEIVLSPGRELDHDYTLMTEHVCPVGALTSQDFRFKARVWFLKSAPGVCTGCATGCNTHVDYDPRYGKVYRLRPRDNMDVNKFWMCDDGMMTYREVHEDRVNVATLGRGDDRQAVLFEDAVDEAVEQLRRRDKSKVAVVLSAKASCEDNFALAKLAQVFGSEHVYLAANSGWEGDEILRSEDNNPNRAGAEKAYALAKGGLVEELDDLVSDSLGGDIEAVITLGAVSADIDLSALEKIDTVISLTSNDGALPRAASIVLPTTSWAETHGTFINKDGLTQTFKRAIHPAAGIKPAWEVLRELATALGHELDFESLKQLRASFAPPPMAPAQQSAQA